MKARCGGALVLVTFALAACRTSAPGGVGNPVKLTVLAASSLRTAFPAIGSMFTREHPDVAVSFEFGGTEQIAAQIEQGAPADVFAGASVSWGQRLAGKGLIGPYQRFCSNRLVLVIPATNPAGISSLRDLATKPVKLVIGSESVPIGAYTRAALKSLDSVYGGGYSDAVLASVVSDEDSVASILAKVESGEADAGFVYATDARAAGTQVSVIELPPEAQAVAVYPIAVVRTSKQPAAAGQFVGFVLSPPAQRILDQAGFGPPPPSVPTSNP